MKISGLRSTTFFLPTFLCAVVLATLGVTPSASAQRGVDIERFRPALDGEGFLSLQATRTPGPFRYNFTLWTNWSQNPLVLTRATGEEVDLIDHRITTTLGFQLGLAGRWAVGLELPVVLFQDTANTSNTAPFLDDGLGAIDSTALSDPRLTLRYRFFGEDSIEEHARNEGYGLALSSTLTAPFGNEGAYASEQGATLELFALADFHLFNLGIGAGVGFRHRFEPVTILNERFHDELEVKLGVNVPIPVAPNFVGMAELRWVTDAGAPAFEGAQTAIEGDLGARLGLGDLSLTAAIGTGFNGGVGTPSFRTVLGLSWRPRLLDADGDGIVDPEDNCPHLPEDFDGFEDDDGCLDPDNDNDMIPDADDLCPNDEAEEFRDEDEDGCTDPFRDADGDGIEDHEDSCPNAPEDPDEHQDRDGCPEADNDGDLVEDDQDSCPDEPEDLDGYQDTDGCPDPDNDEDGILDAADGCSVESEDMDGFEDEDGCPDPDNDRDGVADADDTCPDTAETINGRQDGDGCPDAGARSLVQTSENGAFTLRRVVFENSHALSGTNASGVEQLARFILSQWPRHYRISLGAEGLNRAGLVLRERAVTRAFSGVGLRAPRYTIEFDPARGDARVAATPTDTGDANPPTPTRENPNENRPATAQPSPATE